MRRAIFIGLAALLPVVFFADGMNRAQVGQILRNTAAGTKPLDKVAFVFPLIPHPTPKPIPPALYPYSILFGEDIGLKYEDLGAGYWQSSAVNMVNGEPTSGDLDWQGQFRFKCNPDSDPLHPGHSIVAVPGSRNVIRFAHLGKDDFHSYLSLGKAKWIAVAAAETPAVWRLQPGETVGMRIETDLSTPLMVATESAPAQKTKGTPPPTPKPIKMHRVTFAKIFLRKLSQDTVRFDYVFQTDGSPRFPKPNPLAEGG